MIGRHEAEQLLASIEQQDKFVQRVTNLRKELRQANQAIRKRDIRIKRLEEQLKAEKGSKQFWYEEHNAEAARRRKAEHPVIKVLREGKGNTPLD